MQNKLGRVKKKHVRLTANKIWPRIGSEGDHRDLELTSNLYQLDEKDRGELRSSRAIEVGETMLVCHQLKAKANLDGDLREHI